MKISLAGARHRPRLLATFASALVLMAALAAALPAGTGAEEASQPSDPAAAQLDVGRNHSCAVVAGARVRCWGFGDAGELGYGNRQTVGDDETPGAEGPIDLGPGRPTSISAGHFHTCARLDEGSVRCWGFGGNGRLGYGNQSNVGDNETPRDAGPVPLAGAAKTVSAGGFHSCAVLQDDTVRCWGYGEFGQLGYGGGNPNVPGERELRPPDIGDNPGETASLGPVNFGDGRRAKAISAGGYHTCALLDDNSVRCWGYGGNGQLGQGNALSFADPSLLRSVSLGEGRTAKAISAGDAHTCALLDDGSVRCWGEGLDGRLGYGNEDRVGVNETPDRVPPLRLGRPAVAISAGDFHTCARLDDGSVRCWGLGVEGRLGYGNASTIGDNEPVGPVGPVDLGPGRGALAVSAGGRHTCVRLDGDAGVSCWGYGGNGRLGYCNERNVGDDEVPGTVGPVPLEAAVRAPDTAYPGCARAGGGGGGGGEGPPPAPGGGPPSDPLSPLEREALRRQALRSCLAKAAGHARGEIRRARRGSRRALARRKRHIKRHRSQKRRACLKRHGRTPGRVSGLRARAASGRSVVLAFRAPGSDGNLPPAARTYLVKQSRRPIRGRRAFRRAQTLCKGRCRFPAVTEVGGEVTLRVKDLRRRATYYYAVAARDNVSGRLGPRSPAVKVRTR